MIALVVAALSMPVNAIAQERGQRGGGGFEGRGAGRFEGRAGGRFEGRGGGTYQGRSMRMPDMPQRQVQQRPQVQRPAVTPGQAGQAPAYRFRGYRNNAYGGGAPDRGVRQPSVGRGSAEAQARWRTDRSRWQSYRQRENGGTVATTPGQAQGVIGDRTGGRERWQNRRQYGNDRDGAGRGTTWQNDRREGWQGDRGQRRYDWQSDRRGSPGDNSWRNNRGNDGRWDRSDNRRWDRSDNRGWNRGDNRRWDRGWRSNNRYDWSSYRARNRNIFSAGRYYAPYQNYSYRRLGIGLSLGSVFYGSQYWIDDPYYYRLPEVYGPYRWVRYYNDVLLVDTYTGEVVDAIYDFFW
jgi:hypothetical protein